MYIMDANSLYASIARDLSVPLGPYDIWTDMAKLSLITYDSNKRVHVLKTMEMIGFAMLELISPSSGIPFIGVKVGDRYIHSLCSECAKKKKKTTCRHGEKSRKIVATLTWPEINFMVGCLGYKITNIFEVYQWPEKGNIFNEFINLLECSKLRSESVSESKPEFCKRMNEKNNFPPVLRLQANEISPNASRRKMFKEVMCAVLGKLAQVNHRNQSKIVKSQSALTSLFYSSDSQLDNIFVIGDACLAITSGKKKEMKVANKAASMIVYAYVTAESRIYMHKAMLKLQSNKCRMIAMFNDCLYFACTLHTVIPILVGKEFYTFKHEYNPSQIVSFLSFGVKCNTILIRNEESSFQTIIKARGFSLKSQLIQNILSFQNISDSLKGQGVIKLPQVRTSKKIKTLSVSETIQQYSFQCKIQTDNILLPDLSSVPLGTKRVRL